MSIGDQSILATAYRYFLAVAEAGSMRAASRDLNIASSAVNRQILLLEDAIGMRLFERTGRRLVLTETGDILLRHVRAAAQGHGEAMSAIDALRGIHSGRIRIATVESVSTSLLPAIMSGFMARHPGVQFGVEVGGSDQVGELVLNRDADVGFTFNVAANEGLNVVYHASLPIGAVVSPDHPLAARDRLSLADCFAYPVAYPARNLSIRSLLDDALRAGKVVHRPAVEANSLRVMASLARGGGCVGFQTMVGIERDLENGALVFVPLNDKALALNEFHLICRAGRETSPATQAFIAHATPMLQAHLSH